MNGQLYTMDFYTNLHVGGLGDNLSVVDKQVQRDPITEYPYIQASSLKGAIRAHAEDVKMDTETIYAIFGKDGVPGKTSSTQGKVSFLPANLLLLPLRANRCAYLQATCPAILEQLRTTCMLLGKGDSELASLCTQLMNIYAQNKEKDMLQKALLIGSIPDCALASLRVEGMQVKQVKVVEEKPNLSLLASGLSQLLLISDADMKIVANSLPILAHNKLENGISKTLWYEEVVPRKTVMYTAMLSSDVKLKYLNALATVCNHSEEAQPVVQFGANATLGYGLCKMQRKL